MEPSLVTMGDDVNQCATLLKQNQDGTWGYTASDVVDYLRSDWEKRQRQILKRKEKKLNPVRWGYSPSAVADYLLSDELQKRTQEDHTLVLV